MKRSNARATLGAAVRELKSGRLSVMLSGSAVAAHMYVHRSRIVTHNFFPSAVLWSAIHAFRTTTTAYFAFLTYIDSLDARAHCNSLSHTSTYKYTHNTYTRQNTHIHTYTYIIHGPKRSAASWSACSLMYMCTSYRIFLNYHMIE